MERCVEPEWLDTLPTEAPAAMGSRRDLRRLNAWMGNAQTLARALQKMKAVKRDAPLVELGAGDGDLLLKIARRLGRNWKGTRATLVDAQNVVGAETSHGFKEVAWQVTVAEGDVFEWSEKAIGDAGEIVVANLFLHHFQTRDLERLLGAIKRRSIFFAATEPRRSWPGLVCSRLVGFIGCNAVTRHDAPASVRAGFNRNELSRIWGKSDGDWELSERKAGLFGHLFVARKKV
jgi:hypothetical protein